MVEIHFMPVEGRITRGNAYLPAAYIYGGTIIIDDVHHDSAIMISPFGMGLMMNGTPEYSDLEPEDSFEKILDELICHELTHEFVDWKHEYNSFNVRGFYANCEKGDKMKEFLRELKALWNDEGGPGKLLIIGTGIVLVLFFSLVMVVVK